MKEININDYVNIKLTEAGIVVLKEKHDKQVDFLESSRIYALKFLGDFNILELDEEDILK